MSDKELQAHWHKWLRVIILLAFALLLGGLVSCAAPNVEQPIEYSHQTHIDAGIGCLYCHSSAPRAPMAGIPSAEKCMGCHQAIATDDPTVQTIADLWQNGEDIPWQRVNHQPDFVYFSHQPHVNAGVNCESCHGNVGTMDTVQPVYEMDMGWCLDCHEAQEAHMSEHLRDCLVCHE